MGGLIIFVLVLGVIGFLAWQFMEGRRALATTSVVTPHTPAEAVPLISSAFDGSRALLWTETSGPGSINMRRRGYRRGITMSIDIVPLPAGGSRIDMWASQYLEYFLVLVNFAGVVNRRKKAIARIIAGPGAGNTGPREARKPVSR